MDDVIDRKALREYFDRVVGVKADLGFPFTLDEVAATMGVPTTELRSSWLTPFANRGELHKVGMEVSRNPRAHRRHITVWQGRYYLDLEAEEEGAAEEVAS